MPNKQPEPINQPEPNQQPELNQQPEPNPPEQKHQKPEILKTEVVASSRLFRVESVDLRFSNGVKCKFERLAGGARGAVAVVPLIDDNTVLLVREYGVGLEDYEFGLPKGKVDAGETHLIAANRELKEEVGYGARKMHLLKCLSQSPSYMQQRTHIIVAEDLYIEKLPGDEPEPLEVKAFKLEELDEWVLRGDISEARTIAGLYLARSWLANRDE